uniref:WW domain-containing protein n=1 Tax=Trypanosoma vivax (strain Y486) TaxID=1055687 RepID=G0TVU9_TRYVY|nr:conserved hypothetical protein [Trypanosoma vivax Y486]
MYTFRRPTQQSHEADTAQEVPQTPDVAHSYDAAPYAPDGGAENAPLAQPQEQCEEAQQTEGQLADSATPEDVLRYCRHMVLVNPTTPPPWWSGVRHQLPTTVAELHLTPSSPVELQVPPHIIPSPCVVIKLDSGVPEGMTPKEYSKSLVKYVIELLAYQRATTAITSLRFVKIGTELLQLVLTFGRDVRLAARVLTEFTNAGLSAAFAMSDPNSNVYAVTVGNRRGSRNGNAPPCATFKVTDYEFRLNGGKGIASEDVAALLRPPEEAQDNNIQVIAGYEPGVFYAAVQRPGTVYDWLWNPFCSFLVQHTLFERCGVLITMADCPDDFAQTNETSFAPQHAEAGDMLHPQYDVGEGYAPYEDHQYISYSDRNNADATVDNSKSNYYGGDADDVDLGGRGVLRRNNLEWARNAKEEVDIFSGLIPRQESPESKLNDEKGNRKVDKSKTNGEYDDFAELVQETQLSTSTKRTQEHHAETRRVVFSSPYALQVATGQQCAKVSVPVAVPHVQNPNQYPQQAVNHPVAALGKELGLGIPTSSSHLGLPPGKLYQTGVEGHAQTNCPKADYPELVEDEEFPPLQEPQSDDSGVKQGAPAQLHGAGPWAAAGAYGGYYQTEPLPPYCANTYAMPFHQPVHHYGPPVAAAPPIVSSPYYSDAAHVNMLVGSQAVHVSPMPFELSSTMICQLEEKILELVGCAFPLGTLGAMPSGNVQDQDDGNEKELNVAEAAANATQPDSSSKSVGDVDAQTLEFPRVPCSASVPRASPEIEELLTVLENNFVQVTAVITSSDEATRENRLKIVDALLAHVVCNSDSEGAEWPDSIKSKEPSTVGGGEDGTNEVTGHSNKQLRSLLPYLLTSNVGAQIVSGLASHHADKLLPLLARYVLPFLLDPVVVHSVCAVALRSCPLASNPLVRRVLRHLAPLTAWFYLYIRTAKAEAQASARAELERRLISQVGNTISVLLSAMSDEQRCAVREHLVKTGALTEFLRTLSVPQDQDGHSEESRSDVTREPAVLLWNNDGAMHRSILRLYLNADVVDGKELADLLFPPKLVLTRDQYYFVRVTLSKNHMSPSQSKETACFCGCFLSVMERELDREGGHNDCDASAHKRVFSEKDAINLLETALHAFEAQGVYTSMRDAYFKHRSLGKRYEKVEALLSSTTPPAAHDKRYAAGQQPQGDHSAVLGASSAYKERPRTERSRKPYAKSERWLAEWTAAMRNYPITGEPFTPLPTGWTSALSRSYGYYYFKDAKGIATYKHPTDATEFMATPQAFLLEKGTTVTLADVIARANQRLEEVAATEGGTSRSAPAITEEVGERWLRDQRVREEALDMAALSLLKVTYRTGSGSETRHGMYSEHSGRHSRVQPDHRQRRRNSRKRSRSRSKSRTRAEDFSNSSLVQRRLSKLGSYPMRGHPFPTLPRGWTCNLSASKGLYYFRSPRGNPVYVHPQTNREYRVTPQAFVLNRSIQVSAIASSAKCSVEAVERWIDDQCLRDEAIDSAVVRMVPITYVWSDDCDGHYADDKGAGKSKYEYRSGKKEDPEKGGGSVLYKEEDQNGCKSIPQSETTAQRQNDPEDAQIEASTEA